MENLQIPETKLYELALGDKKHQESIRDKINDYYISLFAAIIAVTPFIDKVTVIAPDAYEGHLMRLSLTILSLVGLALAVTWSKNLKRTLIYLETLDKMIKDLEKKYKFSYITHIDEQLEKKKSPGRITKYQLVMPYTFIAIFVGTIVYSLSWLMIK
ncbi:MAG: RipA family octameric membrane protein [Janthinobacterium lividum]